MRPTTRKNLALDLCTQMVEHPRQSRIARTDEYARHHSFNDGILKTVGTSGFAVLIPPRSPIRAPSGLVAFRFLAQDAHLLRAKPLSTSLRFRHPPHQIKLVVRAHAGHVGHAVRQAEERGDGADVPDVFVGEAMLVQRGEIFIADFVRLFGDLHREIAHRFLAWRDVGL